MVTAKPIGIEVFKSPWDDDDLPTPPVPETFYVLQESGDRIILEDGSGFKLREAAP